MPDGASRPAVDLACFSPQLVPVCEEYRDQHRARLVARTEAGEPALTVTAAHARTLDGLLSAFFCAADAASRATGARRPSAERPGRIALVAVGGFGRSSVSLHSDVDVLVLHDGTDEAGAVMVAEAFLYPLWDSHIDVGHQVQSVDSVLALARTDLRTATMLLDARCIAGDRALAAELAQKARARVFDPGRRELVEKLAEERLLRHERFGGSRYLLEPDIKNAQGGLRDFDVLLWTLGIQAGARGLDEAVGHGLLVHREATELAEAKGLLLSIRERLHLRAGRRQDRLTFEDQEELAPLLGFGAGEDPAAGELPVERFMQAYYRAARIIDLAAERTLSRALAPLPESERPGDAAGRRRRAPEEVSPGILSLSASSPPTLTLSDSSELEADPALALRFYVQVARRREPPYPFAREAIARVARDPAWCERLRSAEGAGALFLELLECRPEVPVRRGSMLGELHEVGLLLAMVPEFTPLTGRVQHDVYHVYTVDVHSIAAVDRLRALRRGELSADLPRATRLSADLTQAGLLHLGVLLHDVGKGRGGDHSEKGAALAGPICARLGLSPADASHVEWLVRAHLRLYHWAMRRDTSDEETARAMAHEIGTFERLRDLYLLTVVDLSTTNPAALTSWKAHMLDAALDDADAALRSHGERDSVLPRAEALRAELARAVADMEGGMRFLDGMSERYVLTTPPEHARAHARLWDEVERSGRMPRALLHRQAESGPRADLAELVVVASDRPGLLADITAVLAGLRLAVVTASIHTREKERLAFDVFELRKHALDAGPPEPELAERIEKDLSELLGGGVTAAELLRPRAKAPAWAQRKSPAVRTEILAHGDASSEFTVLDVFTRDRVGLLHAIARTLYETGLSIALSKVSTEGDRVADVFYVVDRRTGQKLSRVREAEVVQALRAAIAALDAEDDASAAP